jgi:hypothetical protein
MIRWMFVLLAAHCACAAPADFSARCDDRAAIERVYHGNRTGTKPAFEQSMPRPVIEGLVRRELKQEAVLRRVYGISIPDSAVESEIQRIDATTRAPQMLSELRTALGNDRQRFARSIARPLVVQRELRRRFEEDATLHAGQRNSAEVLRAQLLSARSNHAPMITLETTMKTATNVQQFTWRLAAPAPSTGITSQASPIGGASRGGPYSITATAAVAEPHFEAARFDDLRPDLQQVLSAQLQRSGDVSAVIDEPAGFSLFLLEEKTPAHLKVLAARFPKRSFEQWVDAQPE